MRVKYIVNAKGKREAVILSISDLVIQEKKSLKQEAKGKADEFDKFILEMMMKIRKEGDKDFKIKTKSK